MAAVIFGRGRWVTFRGRYFPVDFQVESLQV